MKGGRIERKKSKNNGSAVKMGVFFDLVQDSFLPVYTILIMSGSMWHRLALIVKIL